MSSAIQDAVEAYVAAHASAEASVLAMTGRGLTDHARPFTQPLLPFESVRAEIGKLFIDSLSNAA